MNDLTPPPTKDPSPKDSGIRTTLLTEPQDELTSEKLLSHLMHVEAKDVTLKFAFDHVRNYGICGALAYAGAKTLTLKFTNVLEGFAQIVGGSTLVFTAFLLFGLNFIHGVTAFSKIRNITNVSKVWYVITTALLLLGAGALLMPRVA